jgi:hypothetical protein
VFDLRCSVIVVGAIWFPVTSCAVFLWCSVILCDVVWSYVISCDAMWCYVNFVDPMWLCENLCDSIWFYVIVCGLLWLCVILRRSMILSDHMSLFSGMFYDFIWSDCDVLCLFDRLCVIRYDHRQPSIIISNHT